MAKSVYLRDMKALSGLPQPALNQGIPREANRHGPETLVFEAALMLWISGQDRMMSQVVEGLSLCPSAI
jgi:hypothetical protein